MRPVAPARRGGGAVVLRGQPGGLVLGRKSLRREHGLPVRRGARPARVVYRAGLPRGSRELPIGAATAALEDAPQLEKARRAEYSAFVPPAGRKKKTKQAPTE